MNTQHDDLEQRLGQHLQDRAAHHGGHPLGLDDVTGRADRIRRNRRVAAGAGLAVAAAIITPVAVLGVQGLDDDGRVDPAPSPDVPAEVARTTLAISGLERGEAPEVEYFTPDGVVLPGRGLVELDESLQALVPSPADGGWIAVGPNGQEIRFLTEDLQPQGGLITTGGLATTPDRGWVSWNSPEPGAQELVAHSTTEPGAGRVWDLPARPDFDPVDFVAEDRVVIEPAGQEQERVDAGIAEPDGTVTPLPGFVDIQSANPTRGLIAVQTRENGDSAGCFGVLDVAVSTSEPVWETCEHALGAFSPDGRYVMATSADSDGLGLTRFDVLDAETGALVASFTRERGTDISLVMPVWESADTVVAVAVEDTTQTMVRLGVDGTLEEVVDPVQGDFGDLYFYLGQDRTRL